MQPPLPERHIQKHAHNTGKKHSENVHPGNRENYTPAEGIKGWASNQQPGCEDELANLEIEQAQSPALSLSGVPLC